MVKILVCGNIENNIATLLKRLKRLKGGPFDYLICCGEFFPKKCDDSTAYLNSLLQLIQEIKVIAMGKAAEWLEINNNELIKEKLILLGDISNTLQSDLAIFSYYSSNSSSSSLLGKRKNEDGEGDDNEAAKLEEFMMNNNNNISIPSDILISNRWPSDLLNQLPEEGYPEDLKGKTSEEITNIIEGSDNVKMINSLIYPRYHFAPSYQSIDSYFERSPFSYSPFYSHSCRFISIPPVGSKQKWIYAVGVTGIKAMSEEAIAALAIASSPNPFILSDKKPKSNDNSKNDLIIEQKLELDEAYGSFGSLSNLNPSPSNFFFDSSSFQSSNQKNQRVKKEIENCWFCLNSDKVEEHMITSIGNECYLAIPKGGLVDDHMLIIPLDHITSPLSLSSPLQNEILLFKERLNKYAEKTGRSFLFYERNVPTQYGEVHFHIQCIPVPSNSSDQLLKCFYEKSSEFRLNFLHIKDPSLPLRNFTKNAKYYFVAELPDRTRLLHLTKRNERHPLQLGREVAAEVLHLKERINWKDCAVSKEREKQIVATFKSSFAPFDIS